MNRRYVLIFRVPTFFMILFLYLVLSINTADALNVTAANLDFATVQAAVDQVYDAGGGNVFLPAGTATWTNTLKLTGGINLIGAGAPHISQNSDGKWGPAPTTVIIGAQGAPNAGRTITINEGYSRPRRYTAIRIANIKFTDNGAGDFVFSFLHVRSGVPGIRIDHCEFSGANYQVRLLSTDAPAISPATTGVVDHCNFFATTVAGIVGYGVYVGPQPFIDNKPLGTSDAVFMEDNYFNGRHEHPISGFAGAHIVFRYNKLLQKSGEECFGTLDVHGPGYPNRSDTRGGGPWEIYGNSFIGDPVLNAPVGARVPAPIRMRSLHGVIFNNHFENHRNASRFLNEQFICPRNNGCTDSVTGNCCDDAGSLFICGNDRVGTSSNFVPKVYIWNNEYVNIVPSAGETVHFVTTEACSRDPLYGIQYDTHVVGHTDGQGGSHGTPKPGYTPYPYPHPLTQNHFMVTPSAGANGSISPNTPQPVVVGGTTQFTVTPNSGYAASVGGTCGGTSAGTTFTTNAVNADCTVTASFSPISYTVTPSAGANGSISPNAPQPVVVGDTAQFTVTPNSGYTVSVGGTCGGTLVGTTYTTNPINANCTVTASFGTVSYTVTPSANANGSINPAIPQPVVSGNTIQFTVTPNSGYTVSVGGTCGGALVGTTYTTNPISVNCTVTASFIKPKSTPDLQFTP